MPGLSLPVDDVARAGSLNTPLPPPGAATALTLLEESGGG